MSVPKNELPISAQLSGAVPSNAARALCITPMIGLNANIQEYLPAILAG